MGPLTSVADEDELIRGKIVAAEMLCSEYGLCVEELCGHAIVMA